MKRLLIIKTGGKIASLAGVPGDYEDWIATGLGEIAWPVQVVDVQQGEVLPDPSQVAAIVVTGSASMVSERAAWVERSAAWLREALAAQLPLLGICFGHQLLAYALGGEVGYNPRGVEVGTATIRLFAEAQHDPLFRGMPPTFPAQVSHRQSVLRLPEGARLLGESDKEPHQAFAWGSHAWGIQFHPEFDAPIIRFFIESYRQRLCDEGDSVERLLAAVKDSPHSASLLRRFALLAADRLDEGETRLSNG
jgi:GMP synthase (glutamine-hydrolysing)